MARIVIQEGDLTQAQVDVIVNAANTALVLGAGVAGAIRESGGPEIQAECDRHGPVRLGEVAVTGGGELQARWIVHAAGMEPGGSVEEETLRAVTRRSLEKAQELGAHSIAFPAIGTGVGGFPMRRCAEVMLGEAQRFVDEGGHGLEEVRFVVFGEPAYRVFEQVRDSERIRIQMARLGRG